MTPELIIDWLTWLRKKVKCNLRKPACSRCVQEDTPCVYSSTRRRPGPAKVSRREPQISAGVTSTEAQQPFTLFEELFPQCIFTESTASLSSVGGTRSHPAHSAAASTWQEMNQSPVDPQLQPCQELQLLESFFTYIHPSIPLLRRRPFLQRYERGCISRSLLLTILGISARLQGLTSVWTNPSLEICLRSLITSTKIADEEISNSLVSLGKLQQACLLAFYEFHQYPGQNAWLRVGQLTRKAYQFGLHQLDNQDQCPLFDINVISDAEIEEWRSLWWCIYCLDSYCNITAATPFVVELDSVKTGLVQNSQTADRQFISEGPIFLPAETELLWKTSRDITSRGGDFNFNIHIVTTTMLRGSARLSRLWRQNPSDRLRLRFDALKNDLSAIRLSLPTRYFNLARDVLLNESNTEHHARLTSILHLHASRFLLLFHVHLQENESEWLDCWRRTLEYCDDMVLVVREWDAQQCLSVDPAICFIISQALMIIHLHAQDVANLEPELQARLQSHKDLLLLFLEQFATIWNLPRFLITSFKKLSERFSGPLTNTDIDHILKRMQGALHSGWFRFLSITPEDFSAEVQQDFDINSFPEMDFTDWGLWGNPSSMGSIPQSF
ncbi:putative fungal-specific transcription factor [Cadophora sp. MPI-SDFR-AT-0126]|nr:putative fungal-specific transcription factor [Leotiomycetes sp. MPI-SDFR-AT-0126]